MCKTDRLATHAPTNSFTKTQLGSTYLYMYPDQRLLEENLVGFNSLPQKSRQL